MYVNKNSVSQLKDFNSAAEFRFLFDFMRKERILVQKPTLRVEWGKPAFEKLYWRPSHRDVFLMPGERKVPSDSVMHHGIHYLMNRRYPTRLKNTPQLTLMMECLASSLDFYFASIYLRKCGRKHPFTSFYVNRWHKFSKLKLTKSDIVKKLNLDESVAFDTFKDLTLEMYSFCQMLLTYCSQDMISQKSVDSLNRKLPTLTYRDIYQQFDTTTFLLYVLGFCSPHSSKKDLAMVRDLKHKLVSSSSMMEFLEALRKSKFA